MYKIIKLFPEESSSQQINDSIQELLVKAKEFETKSDFIQAAKTYYEVWKSLSFLKPRVC